MGRRTRWFIVSVFILQLLAMVVVPVDAGTEARPVTPTGGSIILDSDTMQQVATLGVQMQAYLHVNGDGTLMLSDVDATALAVSDEYVANYKAALAYVNGAIKRGLFTVDEDFHVQWPEEAIDAVKARTPGGPELEWYAYPTDPGLYVHFDYDTVYDYLPGYGLSTALSLAAYCGRPWIVTPYTYHFTYYPIYTYYYVYAYPCCGVWSYVPWYYLPYYTGYYYPAYRYVYYWYPYSEYWYYCYCYY